MSLIVYDEQDVLPEMRNHTPSLLTSWIRLSSSDITVILKIRHTRLTLTQVIICYKKTEINFPVNLY